MIGASLLLVCGAALAQERPVVQAGPWAVLGPVPAPAAPATEDDPFSIERRLRKGVEGNAWSELAEGYASGRGREKRTLRWLQCEDAQNLPPAGGSPLDTPAIDFNELLGTVDPENAAVAAYLYRGVTAASAGPLAVSLGSDDGLRLWLNGELLLDRPVARGLNVTDEAVTLPLRAGVNHLVVKIINVGGAWRFQMRESRHVEQAKINAAIERGVKWLLNQQLLDGSWADQQGEYRNGTTALALYTLLKSGVGPRHPAVLQALAYLQSWPAERTYAAGCELMAALALHDEQYQWWAEETAGDLLTWQEGDGGWSYPGGHTDLSLTQYAALGLRASAALGAVIPPEIWNDMAEFALEHQESWRSVERKPAAGFHYREDHGFTGSMTTAGISILVICREQLGDRMKPTIRKRVDEAIAAGERWLNLNFTARANPGDVSWHYYYLYGLERCGALLNTETFNGREWYWEGAEWLVSAQGGTGAWGDPWGWYQRNTCFALLFLERATARVITQPVLQDSGTSRLVSSNPAEGALRLKIVKQTPAVFWAESEDAGIVHVEYFTRPDNGEWSLVLESSERRFAGRWAFPFPGKWEARAEGVRADGSRVVSGVVKLTHEEGIGDDRLAYATDARRNKLPQNQPTVKASSEAPGYPAVNVADNFFSTRWVCAPDDAAPWIELRPRKAVRATELRLSHSRTTIEEASNPAGNPRPVRVEIQYEKDGDPEVVDMDPDPFKKTVVRFKEPKKISFLRIRVLEIADGELGKNATVGFTEIELQDAR